MVNAWLTFTKYFKLRNVDNKMGVYYTSHDHGTEVGNRIALVKHSHVRGANEQNQHRLSTCITYSPRNSALQWSTYSDTVGIWGLVTSSVHVLIIVQKIQFFLHLGLGTRRVLFLSSIQCINYTLGYNHKKDAGNMWFQHYWRKAVLGRDLHAEKEPHRTALFRLTRLYKAKGQLKSRALNSVCIALRGKMKVPYYAINSSFWLRKMSKRGLKWC